MKIDREEKQIINVVAAVAAVAATVHFDTSPKKSHFPAAEPLQPTTPFLFPVYTIH